MRSPRWASGQKPLYQRACEDCGRPFGSRRPDARWCPETCRRKHCNPHKKAYDWTPEIDETLRQRYARDGAKVLGAEMGISWWCVQRRARKLGLAWPTTARPWPAEDLNYLEDAAGALTVAQIAKHLKRTPRAVAVKMTTLGLSQEVREGHTANGLARCFGVSPQTVEKWIHLGLFGKVRRLNPGSEKSLRGQPFHISDAQVLAFIRHNPRAFEPRPRRPDVVPRPALQPRGGHAEGQGVNVKPRAERRLCVNCRERPARHKKFLCKVCDPSAAKYGNTVVNDPIDGRFDAVGEARRWRDLSLWQVAGAITNLQRQVRHPLVVNDILICTYVTDFEYDVVKNVPGRKPGDHVVEDFKGAETAAFRLKAKLLLAVEGLHVTRVHQEDLAR